MSEAVPLSAVVCKLTGDSVWKDNGGMTHVSLSARYNPNDDAINRAFSDATPAAQFTMLIGVDKPAAQFFQRDKVYLVTIAEFVKPEEPPAVVEQPADEEQV